MDSSIWAQRYPGLFESSYVDYANTQLSFTLEPDEIDAIGRLHLIALTADDHVLVCASADGWRFLPGGTREPGENLLQLAARELMEEAGAELGGELDLFGAHVAISGNPGPYRSHLPHPRSLWAYAICAAEIVTAPTSPPGGEVITEVSALPVSEAIAYLRGHDQLMADVLALAVDLDLVP